MMICLLIIIAVELFVLLLLFLVAIRASVIMLNDMEKLDQKLECITMNIDNICNHYKIPGG